MRLVGAVLYQGCWQQARVQEGFEQQPPAHFFHEDCSFDRAEAYPAKFLGNTGCQPAQLRMLLPLLRGEMAIGGDCLPVVERVAFLHVAPGAFLQHALLIAQFEIHGIPLKD
ncbi:hypothetical protein D3C75_871020 [compost metagenome]